MQSEFFDEWTERGIYPQLMKRDVQRLLDYCPRLRQPGQRVADVGCGTGLFAQYVRALGHHVTGFDISESALRVAVAAGRIDEMHVGTTEKLPAPDESFDVVVCTGTLLYVLDMSHAFREFRRVLKPGGEILIVDHHARNPYVKLHFNRPQWAHRLIDGRENIPCRALTEGLVAEASGGDFTWDPPRFESCFTFHPKKTINTIHDVARSLFGALRAVTSAAWTGNVLVMVGRRA